MNRTLAVAALLLVGGTACKKAAPDANPAFSDALTYVFRTFDGEEADLAYAVRSLEEQVYLNMDLSSSNNLDRALTPEHLTADDVGALEHPGRDLSAAIPVAVGTTSKHDVDDTTALAMLTDLTPVEPYSPDYFLREFLDGEDCWPTRKCDVMQTYNDLIKDNALMTIPYWFYKDYRWVDLNLPDPADVPEGEQAVNSGDPRWAYVARSWTTETFPGDSEKNWIMQSFTIELWVPRDGGGYTGAGEDSTGGGTLRLLALWSETDLGGISVSDDVIAGTTRVGIDDNFEAQEEWLDAH